MNGKIIALRNRGFNLYREGAAINDASGRLAKYGLAKKEFNDAVQTYNDARTLLKNAPAATDPKDQTFRVAVTHDLLASIAEVYRLLAVTQIDTSQVEQTGPVYEEFIASDKDPAVKLKARQNLGDIYRAAGNFEKAIETYKLVLEAAPDNQEVMAMIGLCYVGLGTSVDPMNKEQLQEGLNYMDKYAQNVQILDTDTPTVKEFKQSVKDTVVFLKEEQKLKSQKPAAPAGRRKN